MWRVPLESLMASWPMKECSSDGCLQEGKTIAMGKTVKPSMKEPHLIVRKPIKYEPKVKYLHALVPKRLKTYLLNRPHYKICNMMLNSGNLKSDHSKYGNICKPDKD